MNTLELQNLLMSNPLTDMGKVCALNQLPENITERPALYIVNSRMSDQPGKHWLALYYPNEGPVEFFDSLGRQPNYYHWRLERYLNAHGYISNQHRFQQAGTSTCG